MGAEREQQQQQVLPRDFSILKLNKTESRCACGFIWGSRSLRPHLRPVQSLSCVAEEVACFFLDFCPVFIQSSSWQ